MNWSTALLRRVSAHVRRAGVIAYATEGCYGLGCDPRNYRAVRKLLRIKQRPAHKGLILIAADFAQIKRYCAPLSTAQRERAFARWPGPHTWLMPASPRGAPRWLRGRRRKIALRLTAHTGARALCQYLDSALVSTSANRSGRRPCISYRDCVRQFGTVALVLPGKVATPHRVSTIQDLESERIVRTS